MRPLAELKTDLEVTRSLGDIVDVLKTAASIQLRSFQLKEKPNARFAKELEVFFELIMAKKAAPHPYLFDRKNLPSVIVIVTSDEGFLGELNTLLVNTGVDQANSSDDEFIVIGERGVRYLEDMNKTFVSFPGISDEIHDKEVYGVSDYVLKKYRSRFGRVIVIYPEFISLTAQRIKVMKLLPYEAAGGIMKNTTNIMLEEMLIEPFFGRVLGGIVELWLSFSFFAIFWSSKLSEFSARIIHLEGSTQGLELLNKNLAFEYFRQMHALKDKVIREISASKILLGKGRG